MATPIICFFRRRFPGWAPPLAAVVLVLVLVRVAAAIRAAGAEEGAERDFAAQNPAPAGMPAAPIGQAAGGSGAPGSGGAAPLSLAERARLEYERALAAWQADPKTPTNALWLARTSFDWADSITVKRERARVAGQGIQACRRLIRDQPDLALAHYYLALNLGELAETKTLGALTLVDEMEQSLKTARQLDPLVDFAGPDRSLGLLYHQAPGWPLSVGSKSKARQHLQDAVLLAPEYPGNHLDLLEACVAWKDGAGAAREVEALRKLLPSARGRFTGAAWEAGWAEWNGRWRKLEAQASGLRAGEPPGRGRSGPPH